MKIRFGGKSKLFGREVFNDYDRIAYAPLSDDGLEEYILSASNTIPNSDQEPDLFRGAEVVKPAQGILELKYHSLGVKVVLTTIKADDSYRKEHPDLIQRLELFRIDE